MRWFAYVIIALLCFGNLYGLWDKLPNRPIFVVYGIILSIEAIVTLSRYEYSSRPSFFFVLIGVVLFAVSDNLLAFLKFNEIKTNLGRFVIMLTYYGAQYFIMHGALHQSNLQYEIDTYESRLKKTYWFVYANSIRAQSSINQQNTTDRSVRDRNDI